MSEHTETPWEISPVRTTEDTAMIVGGKGFEFGLIADVTEDFDAAFIVKAVNSHQDLINVLDQIYCVCRDNAPEACNQRLALDFVRQLAEGILAVVGGSREP